MELEQLIKLGVDEDKAKEILGLHDNEITGLKSKNDELLNEKKTAAERAAEMEQAAENARTAAQEAEKQRLANEGKFDELKKLHEKEIAEATARANELAEQRQQALIDRDKNGVLSDALSLIHDDFKFTSKAMLSNMIDVSYNEDNQPVVAFNHEGQTVANSIDEFKGWALSQDGFKNIMNGVDSSGAGASNANGASSSNDKDAAYKQRLKAAGLT